MLLNDYVQLCHINAFYYGNMYIYCQCQNNSSTRLHFALFTTLMEVLRAEKSRANEHRRSGLTDFTDLLVDQLILAVFEVFNKANCILPLPHTHAHKSTQA